MVNTTVIVNTGATVWLSGTVHLSALDIAAGGTVRVLEASNHVLVSNGLSIAGPDSNDNPGGLLDLGDNDLIVHGGSLGAITQLLKVGYDGGLWDGPGVLASTIPSDAQASIVSSVAEADPSTLQALGVGEIGQPNAPVAGLFDGWG